MILSGGKDQSICSLFLAGTAWPTLLKSADVGLHAMLLVVWVACESGAREAARVESHVAWCLEVLLAWCLLDGW